MWKLLNVYSGGRMVFVKAFVIGGLICAAVQILMEKPS